MGALVENASERAVIERAYAVAQASGQDAIILANFSVGGRQVDALVATEAGASVIEAKGVTTPIEGDVNGDWRLLTAAGPVTVRNGYQQVVAAKNAVRDAMAKIAQPAPYPDAAVIITPRIPKSSKLTSGDHKAQVMDLQALALPSAPNRTPWPLQSWRTFAQRNSLAPVQRLPALFNPALLSAETALQDYSRNFLAAYGPRAACLLAFPCKDPAGEVIGSEDLASGFFEGSGILLQGPPGCGKSLAGLSVAVRALATADLPVVVEAKLFEGRLRSVLDPEVALLRQPSFQTLTKAVRLTGRRLLFVVDGYNECRPNLRLRLTRTLAELVRRTGGRILVSSQIPVEGDLLALTEFQVPRPPAALKTAIARAAAPAPLSPQAEALLDAIGSGLEARIVGEVGGDLPAGASRFALFDTYVRRRLGGLGSAGIATLSRIAGRLAEQLSFALSIRDFDRLQADAAAAPEVVEALLEAGLLARRGDRLSFDHELYLQAFQAEAIVRGSGGDAAKIARALEEPIFARAGTLVLGALDDEGLLEAVLGTVKSGRLLADCLSGQAGEAARLWAARRAEEVFAAGIAEIEDATFLLDDQAILQAKVDPASVRAWTPQERAMLATLPSWMNCPERMPAILAAARRADQRLAVESLRLAPEARARNIPLRSGLFGQTYVFQGFGLGPCFGVNAGLHRWRGPSEAFAELFAQRVQDLTPGEAHVLLEASRHVSGISRRIAPYLPGLIDRLWRFAPYHLKLELLEAAGFCWNAEEADRQRVIETMEGLQPIEHIMLSTQWIESMQMLGALEDDEADALDQLRANMPALLARPEAPEEQHAAWALYHWRFEHPLSGAYCTAYDELEPRSQAQVLRMAATVSPLDTFFASPMIADLATVGDATDVAPIARWAILPNADAMMVQDATERFLLAHMALARHSVDLPTQPDPPNSAGQALLAFAAALYAANRPDLAATDRKTRIAAAWAKLALDPGAAIVALEECCTVQTEAMNRLPGTGPAPRQHLSAQRLAVAAFARAALEVPERLTAWFRPQYFEPGGVLRFALQVIGHWGDQGDLVRLRTAARDPALAQSALDAVRKLEDRLIRPTARNAAQTRVQE